MAHDDETLTFRIRAIAENMGAFKDAAGAAERVNASMEKSRKLSQALTGASDKLTAARNKESDQLGKLRVAEQRLTEIRGKSGAKLSQVAAAEERVATARRNSARATQEANKVETEFKKLAERVLENHSEDSGARAGKRWWTGFTRFMRGGKKGGGADLSKIAGDAEQSGSLIGRTFGSGILSGLEGALKSPGGPYILAGLMAALSVLAPGIGAVLGAGVVAGFGAGIAALPIVFALKSDEVKAEWKKTLADMGSKMSVLSKPFETTMINLTIVAQRTFGQLTPALGSAFKTLAPAVLDFGDKLGQGIGKLGPMIKEISTAFAAILRELGPGLNDFLDSLSSGMIRLSQSIEKNPTALADFARGVGYITHDLLTFLTLMNDADGAFKRMTGGLSAVDVVMGTFRTAELLALGPLSTLAKGATDVGNAVKWAWNRQFPPAVKQTQQLLAATHEGSAGLAQMTTVTDKTAIAQLNANDAAAKLAAAFDRQTAATKASNDELVRRANLLLGDKGAELDYKQSILDVTAAIKKNGKTISESSAAGIDNQQKLLAMANAANTATLAMRSAGDGNVAAAKHGEEARKIFIALAKQMGFNSSKARQMAKDYIAIPNVTRKAVLKADATDLTAKLKAAKTDLADPKLKATLKARLSATITDLQAQIRTAKTELADKNITKTRKAVLDARITDLQAKLTTAKHELANPNLVKEYKAKLNADIAALTKKLKDAQAQIDGMHGKTIPITYTVDGTNFTVNTKAPTHFGRSATGGKIVGPGSGTSDTAGLYALSNKEYVVRASSASKYGDRAMDSVNAGTATIIPGMARGGFPRGVNIHGYGVFKDAAQARQILTNSMLTGGGAAAGGAGAGVQRWRAVALQALALAHEPAAWIGSLLSRMQRESGGNPRAINLWDSNAKAGTPSIGLMQVIGPTFSAYANGLAGRGIYDPLANIFAAIRYTVARYGSGPAGWNKAGGYRNGGWLMPGQLARNETRRPEAILNHQQLSARWSGSDQPIVVKLYLDSKEVHQSLVHLNRSKGYKGLGLGPGERG